MSMFCGAVRSGDRQEPEYRATGMAEGFLRATQLAELRERLEPSRRSGPRTVAAAGLSRPN